MRELILRFTEDPEWLPSVSQDITDAIHAELADVNADPELRASTYASTDSVLRLIVDLSRTGRPPERGGTATGGGRLRARVRATWPPA